MANLVEKVDYNANRDFGASDLDISWAYLQVKKLYALEKLTLASNPSFVPTISMSNWITKVREQYEQNKTHGIAESSTDPVVDLPGYLKNEVPASDFKVAFEALWTCNDIYDGSKTWVKTNTLFDSISQQETAILGSCEWKTGNNERLLKLPSSWSSVNFDHQGHLNNHKSWVLYIKGKVKDLNQSKMIWMGDKWQITMYDQALVLQGSYSNKTWCLWPEPRASYAGKDLEVYLIKTGIEVSLYINGKECIKEAPQSQPSFISKSDAETKKLTLSGKTWEYVDKVFITDNLMNAEHVINATGQYLGEPVSYKNKSALSQTNTYFASGQYIQDRYGNFIRLQNGFPAYDTLGSKDAVDWFPLTTGGTGKGYVPNERMLELIVTSKSKKSRYLKVSDFNFSGNWTVGFWMRTPGRATRFLTIHSATDDKEFALMYDSAGSAIGIAKPGKTGWNKFTVKSANVMNTSAADNATDHWQYITLVKNGNQIFLWFNEIPITGVGLSDEENTAMGSNELRLNSTATGPSYYSDLSIVPYAMSHIPWGGDGQRTSWPFIAELKKKENA
mgnify:CR=1 FL=1